MTEELHNNVSRAEDFIDSYFRQEDDFISTVIETCDENGYVVLRQTVLGWVDSLYIAPGVVAGYGIDWLVETINNVFAASAMKITYAVLDKYLGANTDEF